MEEAIDSSQRTHAHGPNSGLCPLAELNSKCLVLQEEQTSPSFYRKIHECVCIYIYVDVLRIYIHIHAYVHLHICIEKERERERESASDELLSSEAMVSWPLRPAKLVVERGFQSQFRYCLITAQKDPKNGTPHSGL